MGFYTQTTNYSKGKENNSFTIATKSMKYLEINLTKEMKDFYTEKYKRLMKEVKEDIDKWIDIPC